MNRRVENSLWFVLSFALTLWVLIIALPAWATEDECRGHSCNNAGDVTVNSDVGVESNVSISSPVSVESNSTVDTAVSHSSKAYAFGLGDVDINQCYRSYQVLALWQGTQLNYWCLSESLDARGLHNAAARARCKIDGYRKLFDDDEALCVAESTMLPLEVEPMADSVDEDEIEYQRELIQEQQELLVDMQAKIANLEAAKPTVTRQVVQQPFLSDAKRKALQEAISE